MEPELSYTHKTYVRGRDRQFLGNQASPFILETRKLFSTANGRLVTSFGFLVRVVEILERHRLQYDYIDVSPRQDPEIYTPDWDNCLRYFNPRPRQMECLQAIAANECGLINATMGYGKTHLFEAICHLYPRAKIDILVRPKDVAARITRALTRTIPNVGQVGGGSKRVGDRVTVYTAGSAHYARGSDANFLLADEAHLLVTDKTANDIAQAWRFTRNFGFTATPEGRMDGAHARIEMLFGKEIFRVTYDEAVRYGLVVPIAVRWLDVQLPYNPAQNKKDVSKMRWGIWRNDARNKMIADDVREHYMDNDDQVLILVATLEHAIYLRQYLPEFELCYAGKGGNELDSYKRSKMLPEDFEPITPRRREALRQAFAAGDLRRVIATDVWATGVDFTQLQVVYRADARSSENIDAQAPGRVSRISPETEKQYGIVVDCWDRFDPGLLQKSRIRKKHYEKLGWRNIQ